ncbi:MAG: VanW family protein [Bacillota bacterium]|nr:VanW family protein [Bacillota bacterium]
MLRGNYRITITAKFLILEVLVFLIGSTCGLTWEVYNYNKKWDNLLYPGIKISGLHLNNRSIKEDEDLIKNQYINPLMKKSINIEVNNKTYKLQFSKAIKNYNIQSVVYSTANLEARPSVYEKSKLLQKSPAELYSVNFVYDENYIKDYIGNIKKDVDKEAINASIKKDGNGSITVNPDAKGYKLNEAKLEEEIKDKIKYRNSRDMVIKAPVSESAAVITSDKLSDINTMITSFSTSFSSSSDERCHNIDLASSSINGKVIMPNEIFSFNDCVGERTKERGYMMAPVLVDNRVDSGIGGGICQVSSTLYNAVLMAGMQPIERTHHSLPSSYVELGLDSTVDWNDIDFKFKNTISYPIYIEAYTENKNLYINIYSNSSLVKRKYVISNDVYETIPPETKSVEDPNLPEGKIVFLQKASSGYKVKVTRDTYENGNLVSSELISDDLYPEVPGISKIGTKKAY